MMGGRWPYSWCLVGRCRQNLFNIRCSVKVPEFENHLKKAGGPIGQNVVKITIKMKIIFRKSLMIKIIKLRLRNFEN